MKRGLLALGVLAAAGAARYAALNAGSTRAERRRQLPGDELVEGARGAVTVGMTIEAPPEAVWPWLVDLEAARAEVATSEPEHALVLRRRARFAELGRAYVLERDGDRTRLLVRTRVKTAVPFPSALVPRPPLLRRLRRLCREAAHHYNASEGPVEVAGTA
jgi:hypothetical protein